MADTAVTDASGQITELTTDCSRESTEAIPAGSATGGLPIHAG